MHMLARHLWALEINFNRQYPHSRVLPALWLQGGCKSWESESLALCPFTDPWALGRERPGREHWVRGESLKPEPLGSATNETQPWPLSFLHHHCRRWGVAPRFLLTASCVCICSRETHFGYLPSPTKARDPRRCSGCSAQALVAENLEKAQLLRSSVGNRTQALVALKCARRK